MVSKSACDGRIGVKHTSAASNPVLSSTEPFLANLQLHIHIVAEGRLMCDECYRVTYTFNF